MGVQINGSEGNVIATKGTFSGDVGIGGTLTYEDVTNIDSVGLVTARSGIEVGARPGVAASISVDGNAIFSGITTTDSLKVTGSGGINISSSGADLTMNSAGSIFTGNGGNATDPIVANVSDTNTGVFFPAADTLAVTTGGSERVRIGSDGGIGIGNDSPTTWGGGIPTIEFKGTSGSYTARAGAIAFESQSGSNGYNTLFSEGGNLLFYSGATNRASATERLRIDASGRVIITNDGVTSPTGTNTQYAPLVVRGNTSATSSRAAFINFARSEASANIAADEGIGEIYFGDQQAGEYGAIKCFADAAAAVGDYPGRLSFWTTADGASSLTNRMTIDRNGNITTPYQFHIEVRRTDDQTGYNAGGDFGIPMVFTDVVTTRGTTSSALDTSTGKITVPLDGVYFLEASVVVSGSVVQQLWFTEGNSRMQYSDHTENAMTTRVQASGMHYLSANTQVGVKPYGSGSSSITILDSIYHTWFRVTLMG